MRHLLPSLLCFSLAAQSPAAWQVTDTWKVGGAGGWDYALYDGGSKRLFLSHAEQVVVLSPDGKQVGAIAGTSGVHGVALAPELDRGFTSNGKSSSITVFKASTLEVLKQVPSTGQNPDAILYDPATKQVFAFNGRSGNATVLDAATGEVKGSIALPGQPEFAVADGEGRVYLNLEDKSQIAVIDAAARKVTATWSLAPLEGPSGLAIDPAHHRLFAVGGNKLMAVVDAAKGKVIATVPIGAGADAAAFDPATGCAFSSNGEGNLTVVREAAPGRFEASSIPTKRGARTLALDSAGQRIFLPTADYEAAPAPTAENPHPRPKMVAGSFQVVVVGAKK